MGANLAIHESDNITQELDLGEVIREGFRDEQTGEPAYQWVFAESMAKQEEVVL